MSARDAREPAKEPAERRRGPDELEDSSWEKFKANMRTIGGAVLLAIFIRIVLFEAFEIDGPSMEPTLQHGDRVVVAKMLYGLFLPYTHEAVMTWGSPHLGDVVIVNSPADGVDIVKRVIGVAGDTIEIRDGRILRNGDAVPHEVVEPCELDEQKEEDPYCHIYEEQIGDVTYHVSHSERWEDYDRAPVVVPEGHIYVRGDHRDRSNDSTNPLIGPIPVSRVKGKALFIYLSCDERGGGGFLCGEFRWNRFFMTVD
ncbi:MAG TPA: signal peptidase I [Polyangiaceae bacterium LLY-WYZ-15_(1-7)]|nr:signal peptidase I [Sandaracinus sp.]HJK93157.1 signal peptidase I [Polyangiaceae bacterium LLY-WYZ-15_(1-7)]MBJ71293.1 signal peptidase I [Sandaracinus sp.]MBJ71736.1 signal peptidase I [Sandaracinus sp.]HJL05866.1 signal peptidase I [Polyangiaceae bacterium LLY-WYZ-15_(1-7)]